MEGKEVSESAIERREGRTGRQTDRQGDSLSLIQTYSYLFLQIKAVRQGLSA
jgi:hypothetical protein